MYERVETYDDSWFYTFLQSWKFQSIFSPLVGRMLKLFTPTLRRSMPIAIRNSCVNKIPQFCDSFKNALHFSADFSIIFRSAPFYRDDGRCSDLSGLELYLWIGDMNIETMWFKSVSNVNCCEQKECEISAGVCWCVEEIVTLVMSHTLWHVKNEICKTTIIYNRIY